MTKVPKARRIGPKLPVWMKIDRGRIPRVKDGKVLRSRRIINLELFEVNYWFNHLRDNPGLLRGGGGLRHITSKHGAFFYHLRAD